MGELDRIRFNCRYKKLRASLRSVWTSVLSEAGAQTFKPKPPKGPASSRTSFTDAAADWDQLFGLRWTFVL